MTTRPRHTRGRPSKIEQLPEAIKAQLDAMLREGHTQAAILQHINAQLRQDGGEAGIERLSRSGLNRYSTRMAAIGKEIREARDIADVWVARLGTQPSGDVSKLLMEMLRTQAFKLMVKLSEDPDTLIDADMLKDLALGIQRLEQAALHSHKREKEIRQAFAEEAAAATEQQLHHQGMSRDTIDSIKREILGIA
jgi:hypothetical protein